MKMKIVTRVLTIFKHNQASGGEAMESQAEDVEKSLLLSVVKHGHGKSPYARRFYEGNR